MQKHGAVATVRSNNSDDAKLVLDSAFIEKIQQLQMWLDTAASEYVEAAAKQTRLHQGSVVALAVIGLVTTTLAAWARDSNCDWCQDAAVASAAIGSLVSVVVSTLKFKTQASRFRDGMAMALRVKSDADSRLLSTFDTPDEVYRWMQNAILNLLAVYPVSSPHFAPMDPDVSVSPRDLAKARRRAAKSAPTVMRPPLTEPELAALTRFQQRARHAVAAPPAPVAPAAPAPTATELADRAETPENPPV